jgi:hypothetical protein
VEYTLELLSSIQKFVKTLLLSAPVSLACWKLLVIHNVIVDGFQTGRLNKLKKRLPPIQA